MACFSAVLAFFFFEQKKRKVISSLAIYIVFLVTLYFFYPGAHIVIAENATLFLQSAAISFLGISAIVFGLPLVWRERRVEGEVSWRSAISIIFSMGKRQIRRKKMRGFFTILSIIILILAFTSLTSFGTLIDIVSEEVTATAPADGILVKRMLNESFSPLGSSDPAVLSKVMEIKNVASRLENTPSANPVVRLVNTETGSSWLIYGVLGITPANESIYTHLDEKVEGSYLSETQYYEILVTRSVADGLGVEVGENVTLTVLGTRVSSNFTVVGVIPDEEYASLVDMDGDPFGPSRLEDDSARRCNSAEVVVMSFSAVENLQKMIKELHPEEESQFMVLSDIIFQPVDEAEVGSIVRTLIFVFSYDVFVSSDLSITYRHIGSVVELKGAAELLIPLVMVGLNVSMVMMNAVYERRKEIRILSMLGLNPTHIGLIFVAEAIILGMVGGSLGYIMGLGFFRVMVLFGQELMVREKLDWWWSAIGFGIALAASVLSSIRPAALAVSTYTPSKVRKVKRTEEETEVRKEEIFKVYQERQLSMPVKLLLNEKEFFIGYFLDRLNELKSGYLERVENIEEIPEKENVKGELVTEIKFDYYFVASGQDRRTKNSLFLIKSPKEYYYRARLSSEPAVLGLPESTIDRTIDVVHEIVLYWAKNKERILGI
jgi:ABC-type lipoprotein release transport system permease subunit